jgi:acetyl esterase/lipase
MSMAARFLVWTQARTGTTVARVAAWLLLLGMTGLLVRAEVGRPTLPVGVELHADLLYHHEAGRDLRLDVYRPSGPVPPGGRPAVLAIHGGGWRGGSKREFGWHVALLAQHGFVVVALDYQLSRPGAPSWPANLEDLRAALRWVRLHAREHGVDPTRIAALGASAGGHLAALLGTWPEFSGARASADRIKAVVDFYGPADLLALEKDRPLSAIPVELMIGAGPEEEPERFRDASPLTHVSPDDPPMLLIHGLDDEHVPVSQSQALDDALGKASVAHELILVEQARHGFLFNAGGRDLLPPIVAFLKTTLGAPVASRRP